MIKDYKSHRDLFGIQEKRRHPRLGLLAIAGLALCATAIYAALDTAKTQTLVTSTQTQPSHESAKIEERINPAPIAKPLALPLPTEDTPSNGTPDAPGISAADTPEKASSPSGYTAELALLEPPPSPVQDDANTAAGDLSTEKALQDDATTMVEAGEWTEEQVRKGDSLAKIFSRLDLSPNLLHRIVNSGKQAKELAKIRPGERIRVRLSLEGEMLELLHVQSPIRSLQILPKAETFSAQILDRDLERRVATASGTITNSLYESAQRAGLSDSLIMELANIFGWDIDFALEIRAGDQFSLIYEEEYLDGKKYRNGAILAAEFVNQGKVFRAVRFEYDEGYASYFSPKGESMRKAFLRAPVDFRRISSRFTRARYHPVLGKKRPHRGVDYAAATGTPVKASGDGRVIFRGNKGGYGRTVMIRHGNQYTTLYAHLSKFRSSVKNGSRVRQGQVIGYVGQSGLATGPHLHYEFRVNGAHRNPLTVKLPAAEPLAKKYRSRFAQVSAPLLSQLDLISETMVADAR